MTVGRYFSEKVYDEDGVFTHTRIDLTPLNPDSDPIVLRADDELALRLSGEFVRVLGAGCEQPTHCLSPAVVWRAPIH